VTGHNLLLTGDLGAINPTGADGTAAELSFHSNGGFPARKTRGRALKDGLSSSSFLGANTHQSINKTVWLVFRLAILARMVCMFANRIE